MNSGPSVDENLRKIESVVRSATQAFDILLLPENFAQMPAKSSEQYTEAMNAGRVQQKLATWARDFQINILAGSLAIKQAGFDKPFARSLLFNSRGDRVGYYDKLHLFDVDTQDAPGARYRESATYEYGEMSAAQVSPVGLQIGQSSLQLGLTICYDLRFPELYRAKACNGAQLICVPAAFTYETGQAHWECLLRARAIENQVFIAAPAQVGTHANGRSTWGHSMIIDPWGKVISQQSSSQGLVFAEIDLTIIEPLRKRFPVHEHQRF